MLRTYNWYSWSHVTCWRSHESSDFVLKESLNAQEYESGVRPKAFVMFGSPPARFSILSSSTLPNLPSPHSPFEHRKANAAGYMRCAKERRDEQACNSGRSWR